MNTNEKLTEINNFVSYVKACKEAMRQALIGQDQDVPVDATMEAYAGYISAIEGGGGIPVYTVQYLDWDGTVLKSEHALTGQAVTKPADPQRGNYRFTGWDGNSDNVQSDLTITAQYEYAPISIKVLDYNTELVETLPTYFGGSITPTAQVHNKLIGEGYYGVLENIQESGVVVAKYKTESDALYLFINVTEETGLDFTFNFAVSTAPFTIYYGDGESSTFPGTNVFDVRHIYPAYGEYVVAFSGKGRIGRDAGIAAYQKAVLEGSLAKAVTKCYVGRYSLNNARIASYSLQNCTNLTDLMLDNTDTHLNPYVLNGCTGLKNAVLPEALTTIQDRAFMNCTSLEKLVFLSSIPPTIAANALIGVPSICEIYAPDEALAAYQTAFASFPQTVRSLSEIA